MSTQCSDRFSRGESVVVKNIILDGHHFEGPLRGTFRSEAIGKRAVVDFLIPVIPDVCASCGSPAHLSKNGATGEVTCMRSHCGHDHGFKTVTTDFLLIAQLAPYENHAEERLLDAWREKVKQRRREAEWANNALKEVLEEGAKRGWKE